jgi:sugar lactone lactonase YvrE
MGRSHCFRSLPVLARRISLFLTMIFATGSEQVLAEQPPQYIGFWTAGTYPIDLATDDAGNVYITDSPSQGDHSIYKYSDTGALLARWGRRGNGPGEFDAPNGIAVASNGDIYVSEFSNNRVQRLSSSGTPLGMWGGSGSSPGEFRQAEDLAIDAAGRIYVADGVNARIQVFTSTGTFLYQWGSPGNSPGMFGYPAAIAIDQSGHVFVADGGNNRIQKFTLSGEFVTMWGSTGSGAGRFQSPEHLSVDEQGNLFVSDWGNQRIQKFSSTGEFLSKWGDSNQFTDIRDSVVLPSGDILVADRTAKVQRFSPCTICPPAPATVHPKILLHVAPVIAGNACQSGVLQNCENAIVRGGLSTAEGPFSLVYLLVVPRTTPDVAGVQCGIDYQLGQSDALSDMRGIDIYSWTLCATMEFRTSSPLWPTPGSGNTIIWDSENDCQNGAQETIVAGYFYVGAYSTDILRATVHPATGLAKIASCTSAETEIDETELGAVAFSAGAVRPGCNPCLESACQFQEDLPIVVRSTTWSAIKILYH